MAHALKKIEIKKAPPGFAPLYIRERWVGVVIPLVTEKELKKNPISELGIGSQNTGGYRVKKKNDLLPALPSVVRGFRMQGFMRRRSRSWYLGLSDLGLQYTV